MNETEDLETLHYFVKMTGGESFYCNSIEWNDDNDRVLVNAYPVCMTDIENPAKKPIPEVVVDNGLSYFYKIENPMLPMYWAREKAKS